MAAASAAAATSSSAAPAGAATAQAPPLRCSISQLTGAALVEDRSLFRILGIVVSILAVEKREKQQQQQPMLVGLEQPSPSELSLVETSIVLDDGTGVAAVVVTSPAVLRAVSASVGKPLDCVVRLVGTQDGEDEPKLRAEQLVSVAAAERGRGGGDDGGAANKGFTRRGAQNFEALRWFEEAFAAKSPWRRGDGGGGSSSSCCRWGYPTPSPRISRQDVYNVILSETGYYIDDDDGASTTATNRANGNSNLGKNVVSAAKLAKIAPSSGDTSTGERQRRRGVLFEDLVDVLGRTTRRYGSNAGSDAADDDRNSIAAALVELQMSGIIYQADEGRYLPL